ncbi:MAG: hypothetical protein OJF47_001707 [Nitrospira sp.]|nr:MAG: hypothetical protein OJF47_001707 [Nitrospira sp.]
MKSRSYMLIVTVLVWIAGASVGHAANFVGTTIERIDSAQQTVTFKTRDGQSWTLQVSDPRVLQEKPLARGDQVTVEIDTNDKISHISKLGNSEPSLPDVRQSEPR